MQKNLKLAMLLLSMVSVTHPVFANPLDGSFNRMNSTLDENGLDNSNISLGIKLHIPVGDSSNWSVNLDVPRTNMNSACDKPNSSAYNYVNPAKPCAINPK